MIIYGQRHDPNTFISIVSQEKETYPLCLWNFRASRTIFPYGRNIVVDPTA